MSYTIRLCSTHEREKLIDFLKNSWKPNHVFVQHPHILDWQHLEKNHYNFVVAHHHASDSFHGVLGIISPSFFSTGSIQQHDDLWLAIWKVEKSKSENNALGTELLEFTQKKYLPKSIAAIGINEKVSLLYRLMGYRVDTMKQAFIFNQALDTFHIAHVQHQHQHVQESPIVIKEIASQEIEFYASCCVFNQSFFKNQQYILKRYTNHPSYTYRFCVVYQHEKAVSFFVMRKIIVNQSSCLRIVDWFSIQSIQYSMNFACQLLLKKENAEYIDCMYAGLDMCFFEKLGFIHNTQEQFVPHLFEPFVAEASRVLYAMQAQEEYLIFKGDSDLDRPNFLG